MKERAERLKVVRRIIKEHRVTSQEMLLSYLRAAGYTVTQATLSRDLKLLKIGKVSESDSGYYYTIPTEEELRESRMNYLQDLRRGFISIEVSGNMAVIRTVSGHADTVGIALDNLGIEQIIGTVAGDDTVLVVLREGTTADEIRDEVKSRMPEVPE